MRRCFAAVAVSMQTYDRIVQYGARPDRPALSAAPHVRQLSSEAACAAEGSHVREEQSSAEELRRERKGSAAQASGSGRRVRRRFSDEPPAGEGAVGGSSHNADRREAVRGRSGWSPHDQRHRKERERAREGEHPGRPSARSAGTERGVHAQSGVDGQDLLAELRSRALAEVQARRRP